MSTRQALYILLGLGLVGSVAATSWAWNDDDDDKEGEGQIKMADVPAAARAKLLELAGGARIKEVEKETSNGKTLYEAEWDVDGREHEAAVTAEGELVETEEEVDARNVPPAVREAASGLFPTGAELTFEKKTIVVYEIEAEIDGKEREVLISPTGARVRLLSGDDEAGGKTGSAAGKGVRKRRDIRVQLATAAVGRNGPLAQAIDLYRFNTGSRPISLTGLVEKPKDKAHADKWRGPYVKSAENLKDPWGNQYQYRAKGVKNLGKFDLWSIGPDGIDGTDDDIGNWK